MTFALSNTFLPASPTSDRPGPLPEFYARKPEVLLQHHRASIDPELMLRTLIVGYCYCIRSERQLCDELHLSRAYRWFCRSGLKGDVPNHSTFSKNRHGRFRDSDLFRRYLKRLLVVALKKGSLVVRALQLMQALFEQMPLARTGCLVMKPSST